jgi:environmental stress-induced protein Ves
MTISVLRWADHVPVPWRNGGGVTREVAGAPAGFSAFDWRVSIADVSTSGPFSGFPGVDRTIMGVEGSGMVLSLDGVEHEVVPQVPFSFDGDAATIGTLRSGPTRNLNVMTRRGRAKATLTVAEDAVVDHSGPVVLLALSDGATIATHRLDRLDALVATGHLVVRGTAAIVRITT